MKDFLPFFAYIAAVAYLPLLFVTVKTVSLKKLRDLTFVRALAKDYLRTVPIVALVMLPVLAYPPLTRPYVLALHVVFSLPLALELGHVHLFKTRTGLNTFYSLFVSNARETREFLAQNVTWGQRLAIVAVVGLPLVSLWKTLPTPAWPTPTHRLVACAVAALLTLPFFLNFRKRPEKRKDGYILNPYTNLVYHYFQFKTQYRKLRELIAKHAAPPFEGIVSKLGADENETYVIVIGESSNAQHHHYCGYPRETNEFTDALGAELMRFKGVRSPFAQTIPTLEKTITFADRKHPDLVWTKGSVVDYFRDAGFETYWLSNQYALDDTALTAMTAHADISKCYNFSGMKRFEKAGLDGALLTEFAKFIRGGRKKMVLFLHLIGSHSAYVNRYPDEFRHFDGEAPGRRLGPAKAQILNTYDDSVRYTDWLIAELVKELKKIGGAAYLLYFSDHGEDIYDSREDKIMGHGPLANVPMTSVPFMVWTSPRLDALRPDLRGRFAALPEPAAGVESYNLEDAIHTILDLSSLANSDYDSAKSVFGKVREV